MLAKAGAELFNELNSIFPLLQTLRFRWEHGPRPEPLPAAIALFAAMTNPRLPGPTCLLIPSRKDVASFTAILAAFQAAVADFPSLLERYVRSFKVGERVRVLPSGHVYVFGGEMEYGGKRFFKLKLLDDETASRTFPITDGIRLEKTTKEKPKGKGEALGSFQRSRLDFIIGTAAGGNNALLVNEVVLVTTQRSFAEFLEHVHVSTSGNPETEFPLSQVVPWGVTNTEGQLEFKKSAAASGAPLIAVSSRPEYVAELCRLNDKHDSRVIVDGATRLRDAQVIDDIFDHSKTFIVADHADLDILPEIEKRNCRIWKLPGNAGDLVEQRNGLLEKFCDVYHRASQFELSVHECESEVIDEIYGHIQTAERILGAIESDDTIRKFVSIAYSRLLDVCSLVHDLEETEIREFHGNIDSVVHDMQARAIYIPPDAFACLKTALEKTAESIASRATWSSKQKELLSLLKELTLRGEKPVVIGYNHLATASAAKFLADKFAGFEAVTSLADYLSGVCADCVVLTGWPRARNFQKLADRYAARNVHALAYGIERSFFRGADQKRRRQLSRWGSSTEVLTRITGIKVQAAPAEAAVPVEDSETSSFDQTIDFEKRLARVRKGTAAGEIEPHETREARYVSFVGSTYCYLTEGHSVPKVTGILRGGRNAERIVPMVTVSDLFPGDLVLFRVSADTDKDIIRFLAEHMSAPGEYERVRAKAESWKNALRTIGDTPNEIVRTLQKEGLSRSVQSIRFWLTDVIGPAHENDLKIIARTAHDRKLEKQLPEVWDAITRTRGAHMTAGFRLSQLLVRELPNQFPELAENETIVDLNLDEIPLGKVAIVEIEGIAETTEARSYLEVNRLLWDQS